MRTSDVRGGGARVLLAKCVGVGGLSRWRRAKSPGPVYDITTKEDHKHEDLDQGIGEQRLIDGLGRRSTGASRKN
jgi:hypothetical protein